MVGYRYMRAAALVGLAALFASPGVAADPATAQASPFGAVDRVGADTLGGITGQADLAQVVASENRSEVSNNSVSGHSVTGTIALGAAFQNMNGLSLLSANTGNNVAINSSLSVNIAIRP